jgi:hypothetical protein
MMSLVRFCVFGATHEVGEECVDALEVCQRVASGPVAGGR